MHMNINEYEPCENCHAYTIDRYWNVRYSGYLCDHCDRLAGRVKFRVNAFKRRKAAAHEWEGFIPPKRKFLVAFDVDDTLFDHATKEPAHDVVTLLRSFASMQNAEVLIWSYAGKEYAEAMAIVCNVSKSADFIDGKTTWKGRLPDMFVDDNGIGVPGGRSWLYVGDEEQV